MNSINYNIPNIKNQLITETFINDLFIKHDLSNTKIKDINKYILASVHKSYTINNENCLYDISKEELQNAIPLQKENNERLEFLGDSILYSAITSYIYDRYFYKNEGFLTRLRTKLINGETLAYLAKELNFNKYILISKHIEQSNSRNNLNLLEDFFEAFIGAMFLDLGIEITIKFLINVYEAEMDFSELIRFNTNYKDTLLKFYQEQKWQHPKYILEENNSDSVQFNIIIYDNSKNIVGKGSAPTKKKAEQLAAKNALITFNRLYEDEL
jgi:ribonuclease III